MRTTIEFEMNVNSPAHTKPDYYIFKTEFEFVAVPELFGDVERMMTETIKAALENIDITTTSKDPSDTTVMIVADVFGVQLSAADVWTEDFHKRQKRKEINLESLENDLKYTISLMQSGNTETTVQALNRVRYESQSWVYHILNKHFDQPIPDEYKPDKPAESKPVK